MPCKIIACQCSNPFQDRRYGKGKRVMNKTMKAGKNEAMDIYRCTVCEAQVEFKKPAGGEKKDKKNAAKAD